MSWIDVKERLPKEKERILVLLEDGWIEIAVFKKDIAGKNMAFFHKSGIYLLQITVTHWQPLPEPPGTSVKEEVLSNFSFRSNAPYMVNEFIISVDEFMYYLYMPVATPNSASIFLEKRLEPFSWLIESAVNDYESKGRKRQYVYLTIRHQIIPAGSHPNRPGWHSDGFGTNDINYILYSDTPTQICVQDYHNVSMDDSKSLLDFEKQSDDANIITLPCWCLIRLDQTHIHRPAIKQVTGPRLFVKITFSDNQYVKKGNTHNWLIDYKWNLEERGIERNQP